MRYTIEARELSSEQSKSAPRVESRRTVVEAIDADEAITRYVKDSAGELVSLAKPARGTESIATVKMEDTVFLVRVYAA